MIQTLGLLAGLSLALSPTKPLAEVCLEKSSCQELTPYSQDHVVFSVFDERRAFLELSATESGSFEVEAVADPEREVELSVQEKRPSLSFVGGLYASLPKEGLEAEVLMNLINTYRQSLGKPAFESHPDLCVLAEDRSDELDEEIFGDKYLHQGFRERQLKFWITENMIHQPSEEAALAWWLNSSIHRKAIESNHVYSCGACRGNSCTQLFTSFVEKVSKVAEVSEVSIDAAREVVDANGG